MLDIWTKRLIRNKNQDLWKQVNKTKEQQLMKIKMDEKCACGFIHVENINNILMCAENIEK